MNFDLNTIIDITLYFAPYLCILYLSCKMDSIDKRIKNLESPQENIV